MFTANQYKIVFKRVWQQPERHTETCVNYPAPGYEDLPDLKPLPCECSRILKLNGRYDTKCEIYKQDESCATNTLSGIVYKKDPSFTGIARLHPNDKPDKIVGKKIAMRNAIGYVVRAVTTDGEIMYDYNCANFYNKDVRTAIWKAFWTWVLHWGLPENQRICFIRRINDAIK